MQLTSTSITEIEDLLRTTMGLDSASLGGDGVQRAVRIRMKQCGFKDSAEYSVQIRESNEELQALIETVIVPETWFFRHIEAFQALTEWARTEWSSRPRGRELRVLSAPCSTGEEPYSIAMALLDAGFSAGSVFIDAIDISRPALSHAAQGLYRENSFRSAHLSFRDRYFTRESGGYRISPTIQQMTRFRSDNLLSSGFNIDRDTFDVIFCRNVLIYFRQDKQKLAIAALARQLDPNGLLFVGPAEGCLAMESGFTAIPQRMSFGFRRRTETSPAFPSERANQKARAKPVRTILSKPTAAQPVQRISESKSNSPKDLPIEALLPDLEKARSHADAGRLSEAESICERLLNSPRVTADVYALLGVVQDALGRTSPAEESYRRALYLDPAHHQALIHLASIAERKNDSNTAKRLRDRARRSEERR